MYSTRNPVIIVILSRLLNGKTKKTTKTNLFNGSLSGTTRVGRYQKGTTNLDFTEARDSEWQWHQLDHMQVCISLQHASTLPLSFLQARCPSCRPTKSVKAQKAEVVEWKISNRSNGTWATA